ncbi:MAG: response regulator transcription factor [Thermodesulfobacteriota bacterium]
MKRARILLGDDHRIMLEGLKTLLAGEFDLVGEAEDGRTLVALAKDLAPDVVVLDISMPLLNGLEAARQIRDLLPGVKLVFLTMHTEVQYAARALEAGAAGYVLKNAAFSELSVAIREALAGRTHITPSIAKTLIDASMRGESPLKDEGDLTGRQREVLQLLAEGKSAKEIAAILNISQRTVEFHKYRMMESLKIKTTAELIQVAVKQGLVSPR